MKNIAISFYFSLFTFDFFGQTVTQKLQKAFSIFEKDNQLKNAINSLYIIDAKTGQVVFDKNSRVGLAPASTQKIITSVTAFELLGNNFRYKTIFGIANQDGISNIYIMPSGDPTFGSWRWESTKEKNVLSRIMNAFDKTDLSEIESVIINTNGWNSEQIPDGWIWQDIGNYYGSGAGIINWRENQYDLVLKSGKQIGEKVEVVQTEPRLISYPIISLATSASKGSGDNAFIYLPVKSGEATVRGTIPINENHFVISGAIANPENQFVETMIDSIKSKFKLTQNLKTKSSGDHDKNTIRLIHTEISPSLDSMIYWFNKKSINLYGEALVKTMAFKKTGSACTDSGIVVVKNFWKQKGWDEDEISIVDGSGLSPLNRITTHAQVEILKYAKNKEWYPYFLNSLPEYNGMTIKSGTINGVKGFCGYHKARNGNEYIFSFLVNNYKGSPSSLVNKMYKVLDVLK